MTIIIFFMSEPSSVEIVPEILGTFEKANKVKVLKLPN